MNVDLPSPSSTRGETDPDGYVLAASVVDTFQPERLIPVAGFDADLGKLLDLSVISERADGSIAWRLPNDVRRSALEILVRYEMLTVTLDASRGAAESGSPYQRMFEQYLKGDAIPVELQDLEQLQGSLNAVKLLEGVVADLPDANQVRAALIRKDFISQFEQLTGKNFIGREESLQELRKFVDVLPEGMFDRLRRASTDFLGHLGAHSLLHEVPLVITGMGGMGKTALLSKFVIEHLNAAQAQPDFLFAYIDFDKPGIWPDQPLTVLAEIAQQLALQVPSSADSFTKINTQIVRELATTGSYIDDFDSTEALFSLGTQVQRLSSTALKEFSSVCRSALDSTTRKTLLLVLDTFEEVSQRSIQHQRQLLRFVGDLQRILPRLRVVISGRGMHADLEENANADASPTDSVGLVDELAKTVRPLELKELSEPESLSLLEALGSPNPRLNKSIAGRVGGHPLSLKLAAQLVATVARKLDKHPGDLTAPDIFGKEWLDHMSEALLYRRIIAHIPDMPLQKLADPGLVLRELTADIIFHVLNDLCELKLRTSEEAENLFDRLKLFNQLVSVQSATVVRHRPELRQRILKEMMHGKSKLCRAIWLRAVRYYKDRGQNRTEELYCRLMLGQDTDRLARRWEPGLEKSLLKSRGEMPARARQFIDLMALVATASPPSAEASAGGLDEALLAEEMKLLLSRGGAKEALELFRATATGQVPRYDSALFAVHVRAIAQSGDLNTAMTKALEAMDRLDDVGKTDSPRYEELLLLCCQVTRAQHLANAGKLRIAFRRVMYRHEPLQAGRLVRRFAKINADRGKPAIVLRIAVTLIELLGLEKGSEPGMEGLQSEQSYLCMMRGRIALQQLGPDYSGVDGGLLVRGLAWLGTYYDAAPELETILSIPQVVAVLYRDYGESLTAHLSDLPSDLPIELVMLSALAQGKPAGPDRWELTSTQVVKVAAVLRTVIRLRDNAQGSLFR
jgi:hypothetical protein